MFDDRFTCGYDDKSQGSDVQDTLSRASSQQASEINRRVKSGVPCCVGNKTGSKVSAR
jgi:hypothetical protein